MDKKKIIAIKDFIDSAEKSVKNARKLLSEVLRENGIEQDDINFETDGLTGYKSDDSKIVEGVFTGEEMLGSDGYSYPVASNYSSKSKLVQGDKLKLTIDGSGKMVYKQIQPIERETKVGLLVKENGKFQALCEGKTYNLLSAAVTHFRGEIGDNLTVILPKGKPATFAAIEAIIPKN